ncbi:unannotated protein [freshwater metagenome]|uniref:Unannotated protein n=1 Tax=freshwater metagenome TaxID=449393 RepID=A0A6J7FN28_9ZZZZ
MFVAEQAEPESTWIPFSRSFARTCCSSTPSIISESRCGEVFSIPVAKDVPGIRSAIKPRMRALISRIRCASNFSSATQLSIASALATINAREALPGTTFPSLWGRGLRHCAPVRRPNIPMPAGPAHARDSQSAVDQFSGSEIRVPELVASQNTREEFVY